MPPSSKTSTDPELIARVVALETLTARLESELGTVPSIRIQRADIEREQRNAARLAVLQLPAEEAIAKIAAMPSVERRFCLAAGGQHLIYKAPPKIADTWLEDVSALDRDRVRIKLRTPPAYVRVAMATVTNGNHRRTFSRDSSQFAISDIDAERLRDIGLEHLTEFRGGGGWAARPLDLDRRIEFMERSTFDVLLSIDKVMADMVERGQISVTPLSPEEAEQHALSLIAAGKLQRATVDQWPRREVA